MPYYKNIGYHSVTYHGVCCNVGDVTFFPSYVIDSYLIPCDKPRSLRKSRTGKRSKPPVSNKASDKQTVTDSLAVSMFDTESEPKVPEVDPNIDKN